MFLAQKIHLINFNEITSVEAHIIERMQHNFVKNIKPFIICGVGALFYG
jgi:hypothetical protein